MVRRLLVLAAAVSVLAAAQPAQAADDGSPLARARALYNGGDFDGAIAAATAARADAEAADAAALVGARAHLERYRLTADPADLMAAREALATVRLEALTPRDQVDLFIGLGQSLYLSELFGAAAGLFDTALTRGADLSDRDWLQLLDWWATALDREAQTRPPAERAPVFAQIAARMEAELRRDPTNPVANYWFAAATRGQGDFEGAWDAAVAAWVRSTLRRELAAGLRADLDRLVTQALIPERVRRLPTRDQPDAQAAFNAEWERVKAQWN